MDYHAFFQAAKDGDVAAVRAMIRQGADVNRMDYDNSYGFAGYDPLEVAAKYGHSEVVRELLSAGAQNRVFIDAAIAARSPELVHVWLDLGEDVNAADENGMTPLIHAVGGPVEIVRMLVEAGADVNHRDHVDAPVLVHAAARGTPDVLAFLWPRCSAESRRLAEGQLHAAGREPPAGG